jgi:hypothetical protein
MTKRKTQARIAGIFYLLLVITGIFTLMYVPSKLYEWDNPAQTVLNIQEHLSLFRMNILLSIWSYVFYLILPLALYRLLKEVNQTHAILMVALAVVSVPITLLNFRNLFDVLFYVTDSEYLLLWSAEQLQMEVMMSLKSMSKGLLISQVFWGLWLFPFGYLVFKSGFLPKFFGVFLMVGSVGYVLEFCLLIMIPDFSSMTIANYITIPASIGEIGICLWLVIMGAKNEFHLKQAVAA